MSSPVRVLVNASFAATISVRLMAASLDSVTFSCSAYSPALDPNVKAVHVSSWRH